MVIWQHWQQADGLSRLVVLVLLAMSVATWVVALAKFGALRGVRGSVTHAIQAFWRADGLSEGEQAVRMHDTAGWVTPMVQVAAAAVQPVGSGLELQSGAEQRLTRQLRAALGDASARLHWGQTLLATVGATAPFVGLLGTVWGIVLALQGMAGEAQMTLDKVSGPVGEALVMTAAGLAVAIPAVLFYNLFGRWSSGLEALLDAFAHDLRGLALRLPSSSAPDAAAHS